MKLLLLFSTFSLLVAGCSCQFFDFERFFRATGDEVEQLLGNFIETNRGSNGFTYTYQEDQAVARRQSIVDGVPLVQAVSVWLSPDRTMKHTDIIEAGRNGTRAKSVDEPFTRSGLACSGSLCGAG